MTASGVRARVRAEMTAEIKTVARRHLASDGANLSLRAVARDMGMASSALYRYFASRDELLTALIVDAYNSLGAAAAAALRTGGDDALGRFLLLAHAVREWALADRHQWALIYGSPVPGYVAPADTVEPGTRVLLMIADLVKDAYENGRIAEREPVTGRLAEELTVVSERYTPGAPPRLVAASLSAFFHMSGAISAELFGQLANAVEEDRRGFFDYQMRGAAHLIGLT